LTGLGNALADTGDLDRAIAAYRLALVLDPKAGAHRNLGLVLEKKGRYDEAAGAFAEAVALDPSDQKARACLARVQAKGGAGVEALLKESEELEKKDQMDEAVRRCRRAVEVDAKQARPHVRLGEILQRAGRPEEAVRSFRAALELGPKNARALRGLGNALADQNQFADAARAYRQALDIDPDNAMTYQDLGSALDESGQLDDAIRCFRRALALDPNCDAANLNLGMALLRKGDLDKAERSFRASLAIGSKVGECRLGLGNLELQKGRFAEALAEYQKARSLMPATSPLAPALVKQIREAEGLIALDRKLTAVVAGEEKPSDAAERVDLSWLCLTHRRRYALAARLYAEAFDDRPALLDDARGLRQSAARAARA
jgi:superkiller protein 3